MKNLMGKLEELLEIGGTKKDITLLVISGSAIVLSLLGISPFPFDHCAVRTSYYSGSHHWTGDGI